MVSLQELSNNVISGDAPKTEELTKQAIDEGCEPAKILNDGLIAAMSIVGEKFKKNEFYVPEMLISARAMKAGLKILKPSLVDTGVKPIGTFVVGTINGDLHDIGKNLVAMMMEGAGFEVVDLGVDVTSESFVEAAKKHNAQFVGLSALLTTTMVNMKKVVELFQSEGLRDSVKILVGGAPLTQNYADEIGADGYAADAGSIVDLAKELINV
jgi:5-methyltetrahydrofolate--homocysteine methyltransferase